MTQVQVTKINPKNRPVKIDPAAGLPIKKFMAHFTKREYKEARVIARQLSDVELGKPGVTFRLGVISLHYGQLKKARIQFEKTIAVQPDHGPALQNLGSISLDVMEYDKAEEFFKQSLIAEPDNANAYNNLGACCSYQGKSDEALGHYLKALDLDPTRAQTYRNMAQHHKFTSYDTILISILLALSNEKMGDDDRSHLCFAAFKAFHDLGEHKRAFELLEKGNRLFKSVIKYSEKSDKDNLTVVRRAFRPKEMPSIDSFVADNPLPYTPIFIIGMPRSGTSLTEQVLSSHSQVHGGGELPTLNKIANPMLAEIYGKVTSQTLQPKHLEKFRKQFIAACKDHPHDCAYMTDKMPANFRWVGFVKHALPEAKIINQIRDPRAICWSIYRLRFSTVGNGFAYDQVDLANYYHRYKDLMAYWEYKYPDYIHNLHYEKFTEEQEEGTRALLSHVGLDWEDACLNFHKSKRPVKTASSAQVKKELYKGSSEAWRAYEEFLGPMLDALGPLD
jgi:tetratricopeptide (TPR) repeat protein